MNPLPKLRVKDWSPDDQPREKLLAKGSSALSNAELLAIIIASGNRDETSVELAQRVLQSAGNSINQLGKYSVKQLIFNFKGIGVAKAVGIVAALELGKRRTAEKVVENVEIICSSQIYEYFLPYLGDLPHEELWALFLNNKNHILGSKKISQGGIGDAPTDLRLIYHEALLMHATGLAISHNHPSGNINPSAQDINLTENLKQGLKTIGLRLIDHIIIGGGKYYSFYDEGKVG
jgi:DNA repair protein RadC